MKGLTPSDVVAVISAQVNVVKQNGRRSVGPRLSVAEDQGRAVMRKAKLDKDFCAKVEVLAGVNVTVHAVLDPLDALEASPWRRLICLQKRIDRAKFELGKCQIDQIRPES